MHGCFVESVTSTFEVRYSVLARILTASPEMLNYPLNKRFFRITSVGTRTFIACTTLFAIPRKQNA
jgi:hypothetical protein